jgi:hypothetical protein
LNRHRAYRQRSKKLCTLHGPDILGDPLLVAPGCYNRARQREIRMSAHFPSRVIVLALITAALFIPPFNGQQPLWTQMQQQAQRQQQAQQRQDAEKSANKQRKVKHPKKERERAKREKGTRVKARLKIFI